MNLHRAIFLFRGRFSSIEIWVLSAYGTEQINAYRH
jgi:hypothetical protein